MTKVTMSRVRGQNHQACASEPDVTGPSEAVTKELAHSKTTSMTNVERNPTPVLFNKEFSFLSIFVFCISQSPAIREKHSLLDFIQLRSDN